MPWQAQIFVGESVRNLNDLYKIAKTLNMDYPPIEEAFDDINPITKEDEYIYGVDYFPKKEIEIKYKGETHKVTIEFMFESEGGSQWPDQVIDYEDYTDALVGFEITSRYAEGILNHNGSRPEPFRLDLEGIIDIRDQVRKFWPEAQIYVWNRWY